MYHFILSGSFFLSFLALKTCDSCSSAFRGLRKTNKVREIPEPSFKWIPSLSFLIYTFSLTQADTESPPGGLTRVPLLVGVRVKRIKYLKYLDQNMRFTYRIGTADVCGSSGAGSLRPAAALLLRKRFSKPDRLCGEHQASPLPAPPLSAR